MLNPILQPLEHTAEDCLAWAHVNWRCPRFGSVRWTRSLMADRRDHEMMLKRERFRQQCAYLGAPSMPPRLWWERLT